MRKYQILITVGALFLITGFVLLAQPTVYAQETPTDDPTAGPFLTQYYEAWKASPHAAADTEAFRHWDAEGAIEESCAKCHSTPGYLDFLGEDGSEFGVVDAPAPLGTVVNCDACHNPTAASLTNVSFPSGAEITTFDNAARCMECHQGRASGADIDAALMEVGLAEDPNTVSADLGFINIHYYAAAATLYGSEVGGGYQFPGKVYQMQNVHVPGFDTCTSCHNPHTLEVNVEECSTCHLEVSEPEDLVDIRMPGSMVDFDGDGDDFEGIAGEIQTLQEMTYEAIQTYASEVAGTPIVYDEHAYPYFFIDTNANGEVDEGEAAFPNKYNAFTGTLLKAAYNYQVTKKDPAGYVHNPVYQIQLLYDSIEALNEQLAEPVDLSQARRNEAGHFDVTVEAFRHWDADGEVPGSCAKCHTAEGLPFFMENSVNIKSEPSNSLSCSTCHDSLVDFTTYPLNEVTFPSGAVVSFGEEEPANLCLNCHQGRESTTSVNRVITSAGAGDDEVSDKLTFRNVHYFAAGATLFGGEAQGAYQYEGKEYVGRNLHTEDFQTCSDCHEQHELVIEIEECVECHEAVEGTEDLRLIRYVDEDETPVDYDGDGDVEEPIAAEIDAMEAELGRLIYQYAAETAGAAIVYDSHSHPYWFLDTNANGEADEDESNSDNRYNMWTPTLLRAAYNYQYIQKDPGAYAHNAEYALQILYDSIEAIGGAEAVANFTRPAAGE
jgi:hypothetical protein